jgi:type VI secretion system secreted protein Hcp
MAVDYLLVIDGIKGEAGDSKIKDAVEVDSFSWGASNSGSHASGSGGGSGKVSLQDIHFTAKVNKASPQLMQACAQGTHIKKAMLTVRKQGGDQQDYYVITLEDVLISSYQSGGHSGSESVPTDSFSLNYTTIKFDYKPQKPDGTLDSPQHGGWNVKANAKA